MAFRDFWFGPAPVETRADSDVPEHAPLTVPARDSGLSAINSREALSLGAVYRAVSIRVNALKQLSLDIERGGEILPRPLFIRRPDIDTSWASFVEQTVVSRCLAGNAYWRVRRNDDGSIRSLEVLNPHEVTIRQADSGRVIGYGHRGIDLGLEDIKHLPRMRVPGSPYGLGPIQAASQELRGALDLRDYSAGWFRESGIPSGVLSSDQPLTASTAKDAKTAWHTSQGGKRDVAVLGSGLTYKPVLLSPEDAQFLQSRQFSTTEIARLFDVPATLMLAAVEGSAMTYQNVEQEWIAFIRFGLTDDLIDIEDAITDLLPRTQRARFNVEALLRTDTKTRYEAHEIALRAGWMRPSEVRDIEGLPALAGIDNAPAPTPAPEATQ